MTFLGGGDDDVDVCILRDDVEKLNKILDEELKGTNLFARKYVMGLDCPNFQIRIRQKNINIGLDIFPVDKYPSKDYTDELNDIICEKFNRARQRFEKKYNKTFYTKQEFEQAKKDIIKFEEDEGLIDKNNTPENPVLFFGIDFTHTLPQFFHDYISFEYESIFPLKTLEFEGYNFPVPNKYEEHLEKMFGDWKSFPKSYENIDSFWYNYPDDGYTEMLYADD